MAGALFSLFPVVFPSESAQLSVPTIYVATRFADRSIASQRLSMLHTTNNGLLDVWGIRYGQIVVMGMERKG